MRVAALNEQRLRCYIPAWLPGDQHDEFIRRLATAFLRYCDRHGEQSLANALTRGRLIGGVACAFKFRRLDSAWGGRMRRRRAGLARLKQIAADGWQPRSYYAAIGRLGWERLKAGRQRQAMPPHVREHAERVLATRARDISPPHHPLRAS